MYVCIYICVCVCPTLCDPMDCSLPGFPALHHLLEFAQLTVIYTINFNINLIFYNFSRFTY